MAIGSKRLYKAIAYEIAMERESWENREKDGCLEPGENENAQEVITQVVGRLCNALGRENGAFDRSRFISACKGGKA